MSRAAKRRAKRAKKMSAPNGTGEIQLTNPVTAHFEAFIFGNATKCDRVVEQDSAKGQTVAICGAGPSLAQHTDVLAEADQVWGVNSAAPWLHDHGHPVTHALTIDQTPTMLKEWVSKPPVEYLLASTVHPHLVQMLEGQSVTFFHNFVGIKKPPVCGEDDAGNAWVMTYEDWMYGYLYPDTCRAGSGLNGVTRAVDIARFMGFERIILLGADCAMTTTGEMGDVVQGSPEATAWLAKNTVFHVDGESAVTNGQSPMVFHGTIDGRYWMTKPDLMISAIQIARWIQAGSVECVGDTLPNALKDKDDAFFARLPALKSGSGEPIEIPKAQAN